MIPSKKPISIPILIFFINMPNASPRMMAKMNAISLLFTLGFLSVFITNFKSPYFPQTPIMWRGAWRSF